MQKRVLSFLMVLAMVFSLLPVSMVSAETATADYALIIQKAHNQTEGSLAIDIYLKDNTDTKANVTGYQFKVNPAEGMVVTGAVDATGNDGLAGSDNVFIYVPGSGDLTVGTSRKLVATVTVTGETLPAQVADAITLSDVSVTTAAAEFTPAVETVAYGCDHECAHGEGKWTPVTAAELTGTKLPTGNYYLVEDVSTSKTIAVSDANAKVNICLNGYTLTSTARILEITGKDAEVSICDCTATGEGAELKAGKILLKKYSWGNLRQSVTSKLTVRNVIIEGAEDAISHTADPAKDANTGNAAAFYQASAAAGSTLLVEDVLMRNIDAGKTVNDIRAEATFKNTTFVNVNGGSQLFNIGKETEYEDDLAIFVTNGDPAKSGTRALTIDGCKFIDCDDEVLDTNSKSQITYTLKGDVQAEGAFYLTKTCKLNLDLGNNADVTIRTELDKTEANLGDNVVIAEGATVTAGTVLYDNTGSFIAYKDGAFSFDSHAHDEHSFKAWDDSDSLPIEGSWYLTTDVTLNCARFEIAYNTTLNLDLNGHTIRQTKAGAGIYSIKGKLNLYDCAEEYDAEGNWIGGQITGGDQQYGGAIGIQRGTGGGKEEARPTFNMYGGRLAGNGNGTTSSGGAIYMASSQTASNGKLVWGGLFNMYGGEIYGNTATTLGTAVTVWGFNHTGTGSTLGADPALGMGATFNMYGGKIHGNNGTREDKTFVDGTINLTFDAVFNMYGGEICNNHVERGGAIYLDKAATTVNITGGKIYGNSAVESAGKRALNTKDSINTGRGGAILASNGGNVTIKNAEIKDNYATWGGALAIYGGSATTLNAENVVFEGNYSVDKRTNEQAKITYSTNGNGGAIYFTDANTKAILKNCQFIDNEATKDNTGGNDYNGAAGAIYADYILNLTIDGCTFTGNNCEKESGGAIYLRNGAVADIKNTTITGNTCEVAGAGVYVLGASVAKLTDTVITDNVSRHKDLGGQGVYLTSATSRLVVSGKTIIVNNTHSNGHTNLTDVYAQGITKGKREIPVVEVNELAAGSHMNVYFNEADSPITTNDVASGYVAITSGGSQSTWDCGWITVYKTTADQGRNVSLVNDEFVFGHYHLMPDGTQQEFTKLTSTTVPTDGGYYYLGKDLAVNWTVTKNLNLCFNGFTLSANDAKNPVMKIGNGSDSDAVVVNIYDCTAAVTADGEYVGGGITGKNGTYGAGVYMTRNGAGKSHTLNWYNGGLFDCYNLSGTSDGGAGGPGLYTQAANTTLTAAPVVTWYNGAVFNCKTELNKDATGSAACAVIQNQGTMTIHDGLFYNNETLSSSATKGACYGGALYNGGTLYLKGGKFLNNKTEYAGGAIYNGGKAYITGGEFIGNSVTPDVSGGWGGAIYNNSSSNAVLHILGTAENPIIMKDNSVECLATTKDGKTTYSNGTGGAIYVYGAKTASDVKIDNVKFIGNQAGSTGGAISGVAAKSGTTTYAAKITITNSTFEDNYAKGNGGALYAVNSTTLSVSGSTFKNNKTATNGGALYTASSAVKVTFTNCLFEGNEAVADAGAMFLDWYAATSSIKGCTFANNKAKRGGALFVKGGTSGKMTIGGTGDEGCTFIGNEANDAGAILTTSGVKTAATDTTPAVYYDPTLYLTNCSITENVAKNQTSALLVWGGASAVLTDTIVQNNTSKIYGAVHISHNGGGGEITLAGKTVITDNVSTSYVAYAEYSDLYVHTYDSNHDIDAYIDVGGLTDGAKVGVNFNAGRDENPIFTKNGGAAKKDYFYCTSTRYILTEIDGELALVKYVDEEGNAYTTVQAAINAAEAAGETTFKMQTSVSSTTELNLTFIDTLDLNGKDSGIVTVPEGKELTLIDSATNGYTNENVAEVKVIGAVKAFAEVGTGNTLKRYATIASEADATTGAKTYTAHRIYLAINSKTLRPFNNGVGFKAIFAADEVVASQVTYGVELSGMSDFSQVWKASFDEMEAGAVNSTPNQKTIVIYDAISATNTSRWNANMYGRPFITINGNTYYGKTVDVNMKAMAAEALAKGDAAVIAAVNEMMAKCGVSAN